MTTNFAFAVVGATAFAAAPTTMTAAATVPHVRHTQADRADAQPFAGVYAIPPAEPAEPDISLEYGVLTAADIEMMRLAATAPADTIDYGTFFVDDDE